MSQPVPQFLEGRLTSSTSASAQLFGYLAATKYEVGLVLHFGREAKAHRVLFENRFKKHN